MHVDVWTGTMSPPRFSGGLAQIIKHARWIMSPISQGRDAVGCCGRRHGERGVSCDITRVFVLMCFQDKAERRCLLRK